MRINKMITWGKKLWSFVKLFQLRLKELLRKYIEIGLENLYVDMGTCSVKAGFDFNHLLSFENFKY